MKIRFPEPTSIGGTLLLCLAVILIYLLLLWLSCEGLIWIMTHVSVTPDPCSLIDTTGGPLP